MRAVSPKASAARPQASFSSAGLTAGLTATLATLWLASPAAAQTPLQAQTQAPVPAKARPYPPLRVAGPIAAQPVVPPPAAPAIATAAPVQEPVAAAPSVPAVEATPEPAQPAPVQAPPSLPPPPALTPSGEVVEQPMAVAPVVPIQLPPGTPAPLPPPARPMTRVPRALGLQVGWAYTPSNNLPLSATNAPALTPMGISIDGRFGWQVSGLQGGWPVWVGFLTSFSYFWPGQELNDFMALDYGIFVKHGLFPGPKVRLFLEYGLGAAQVWVRNVGGRGIGHVTRLAGGVDVHMTRSVHLSFELAYKFVNLPSFSVSRSDSSDDAPDYGFQSLNLLAGVWFGR